MNYDTHKYFINFPMSHITVYASTTKLCLDFFSCDTVDIEMKEIGRSRISSRDLSNSYFPPEFSCASDFIASSETSYCKSTAPIPSLDQYVLVYNLLKGSGLDKVSPDQIYFLKNPSNIWCYVFHRFYISSISFF